MDAIHRKIQALLKPRLHAVRPFRSSVEGIVGDYRARKFGRSSADGSEVAVDHEIEDAGFSNFRIVNLDFVRLRQGTYWHCSQPHQDQQQASASECIEG